MEGQLQVNVITSRAKIPVTEATVLITQGEESPSHSAKKDTIIGISVTNQSGNTPILTIPTPSTVASTTPANQQGYTLVDLWIEHPDFITQHLKGVQIFPETKTLQSVLLIPLAEGQSSLVEETILQLSEQDL